MRADIVVEDLFMGKEFKEDAMVIVNRIRPQAFQLSFQWVGLETWIKSIHSKGEVLISGNFLKGRRQLREGALELRSNVNTNYSTSWAVQDPSSFSDWTERVLPKRCARRPPSTMSMTSSTVNRRRPDCVASRSTSTDCQGIRITSASLVMDTVGVSRTTFILVAPSRGY